MNLLENIVNSPINTSGYSIVDKSGTQVEWALTELRALDIIRKAYNSGLKLEIKNDASR